MQRDPQQVNPQGADRDLCADQGKFRGGHKVTGTAGRRRHAPRGAETSGGGRRVAGAGDVQVGGDLRRERMWGAGENERGLRR